MPELPEVEVTRLSFAERIAGARIEGVRLGKPLRWPLGCDPATLVGRTVRGVRRRGKYLLVDLDRGLLLTAAEAAVRVGVAAWACTGTCRATHARAAASADRGNRIIEP